MTTTDSGEDGGERGRQSHPGSAALEELLAACLRVPEGEQAGALESACLQHPELARDLRERFGILAGFGLASLVASGSSDNRATGRSDGPRIFGDFELHEVIGSGGMGIVHRARQISLDRDVVVKLIRPELLHFETTRLRFTREAEAIAQLQHPGIVPIHMIGETDGVPYFAMEFIPGRSLDLILAGVLGTSQGVVRGRDLAESYGGSTWATAVLDVGVQVASALHHAHQHGILHRDVKPSNVLLGDDGRACLIDFGLHTIQEDERADPQAIRLTKEGAAPGTLLYMAPEQLEVGTYDVRSEVYALGASLYELLTRTPPFKASSRSSTERLIRAGGPGSLRALNPTISTDVEAVILRALAVDPARRYVDMHAFEDDLRRLHASLPVAARPDSAWYRARRWMTRQPALASVTGLLLASAVIAPTAIIVQQRNHSRALQVSFDEERDARLAAEDLSGFVIDVLEAADPNLTKPGEAVQQILQRGVERMHARLESRPIRRAEAQRVLGRIHGSLGMFDIGIGLLDASLETLASRHAGLLSAGAEDAAIRRALSEVVNSRAALATVLESKNDLARCFQQRQVLAAEMSDLWGTGDWQALHAKADWMRMAEQLPEDTLPLTERPTQDEILEALRAAARAAEVQDDATPEDVAATLGWLGSILAAKAQQMRGDERETVLREARVALERCLAATERSTVVESLDKADTHLALGMNLKMLGELKSAETHYGHALSIYEERLSPDHYRVGAALLNLAGLLEAQGRPKDAVPLLERAWGSFKSSLSAEHQYTVIAAGNLAGTRFRAGLHDGLVELYNEVLALQQATLPPNHPFIAASHDNRGQLRQAAGDVPGARQDLERSLAIYMDTHGPDHPRAIKLRSALRELSED